MGVILFIIVQGIFPFKEARREEYFYNLILQGKIDTYFQKVNGTGLSADFKDLILRFFSYEGAERPTLEQIKAHPWMQSESFDMEATRLRLLEELALKQQAKPSPAADASTAKTSARVRRSAASKV